MEDDTQRSESSGEMCTPLSDMARFAQVQLSSQGITLPPFENVGDLVQNKHK